MWDLALIIISFGLYTNDWSAITLRAPFHQPLKRRTRRSSGSNWLLELIWFHCLGRSIVCIHWARLKQKKGATVSDLFSRNSKQWVWLLISNSPNAYVCVCFDAVKCIIVDEPIRSESFFYWLFSCLMHRRRRHSIASSEDNANEFLFFSSSPWIELLSFSLSRHQQEYKYEQLSK